MKKCLVAMIGALRSRSSACSPAVGSVSADQTAAALALVPKPLRVERKEGEFTLNKDAVILAQKDSADATNVGKLLADRINRSTGLGLAVAPTEGNGRGSQRDPVDHAERQCRLGRRGLSTGRLRPTAS